jgi:hypothetical protein
MLQKLLGRDPKKYYWIQKSIVINLEFNSDF